MSTAAFAGFAGSRRQRGSTVVELALVLTFAIPLILAPIAIARVLLHANVTQRALGNTVRMVATYPLFQRQAAGVDFEADGRSMINAALRRSGVVARDWDVGDLVEFTCPESVKCRSPNTPEQINIGVAISVLDPASPFTDLQATLPAREVYVFDRYAYASGQQP